MPTPWPTLPILALVLSPLATLAPLSGPAQAQPPHCPPGLARKAVPCVPPGQARQAGWQVGMPLPRGTEYLVIRDPGRMGLPPAPRGTQYVRIDNDILRIAVETARVIESVASIARIVN